jgi:hypothetical protein
MLILVYFFGMKYGVTIMIQRKIIRKDVENQNIEIYVELWKFEI